MILVMISPIRGYQGGIPFGASYSFYQEGLDITASAQDDADRSISDIIISQARTYIMDEAESLNADIQIKEIELDPKTLMPISVRLAGSISPYDKSMLADFLETTMGVKKEAQKWD